MQSIGELTKQINSGAYDKIFSVLYPAEEPNSCRERYCTAVEAFAEQFGGKAAVLLSAPGRTEVCGNHTDHQRGRALAAAVDLDIICVAAPNYDDIIRIQSKGRVMDEIPLDSLEASDKKGGSASIIRGVAAWFKNQGYRLGGFNAYTTSRVLAGSGLSSSAAFEVAIGNMINVLFGNTASPAEIALAGKYAENNYYGKPSGLMDQMASSVGGFVQMDFENPDKVEIYKVNTDFEELGLNLCIVDTKGSHSDLTGDYAEIIEEMACVSGFFGKKYLRELEPEQLYENIAAIKTKEGDRAVLRAMHFFRDHDMVLKQVEALEKGNVNAFLDMVISSGRSSFTCLQNVYSISCPKEQGLSLALAVSEDILAGKGAWRVHGGGFAGTIQAFVPGNLTKLYSKRMNEIFGENSCKILSIRPYGGMQVLPD